MRTKSLSLVSAAFILAAAVMVSYLMSGRISLVRTTSAPAFAGGEICVQRGVAGVRSEQKSVKAQKMVVAEKAFATSNATTSPVPQPKAAVPLPVLPPKITYSIMPAYPQTVLEQGMEGMVLLSIHVGPGGNAEKVDVKNSSGIAELDQAALSALAQWKFDPAMQGGKAIASLFECPVRFELN